MPYIIFSIAVYFAGFLAILSLRKARDTIFGWIAVACAGLSLAALTLVWFTQQIPQEFFVREIRLLDISTHLGFIADNLSVLGASLVSFVALLVLLYAQDYMRAEQAKQRFFAQMCLFSGSMLGIILSASLLQMFVFWELVGLSSYLLIGFWYDRPDVAKAAQKVFTMIVLGDVLLLAGIIFVGVELGSMDFSRIVSAQSLSARSWWGILLIIFGAFVKSAQAPFFFWLPWAMEGPTPVSALLHAATMVKAGVFLALRIFPLVLLARLESVFLAISLTTIMLVSLAALAERDIKRVLAYSTVSQLGFMFFAMGLAAPHTSIFHLAGDAFYKALLFLGAGVFMHLGANRDIFMLSYFNRKKNAAFLVLTAVGVLGIAGLPPFGAFFSKDAILEAALEYNRYIFVLTAFTVFLTNLYISRWFFLIFRATVQSGNRSISPRHTSESAHKELFGWKTKLAMGILALGVLGFGLAGRQFFSEFFYHHDPQVNPGVVVLSVALFIIAFALNFSAYIRGKPSPDFFARLLWGKPYIFAKRGFGFSAAAEGIAALTLRISLALAAFDRRVIDAFVNAAAVFARGLASAVRFIDQRVLDAMLNRGVGGFIALCFGIRRFDWGVIDAVVRDIALGFQILAGYSRLLINGILSRYLTAFALGAITLLIIFTFVL